MRLFQAARFVLVFALVAMGWAAFAETGYPTQPIRMIVGFPPAGGADLIARLVADKLGTEFDKPVIVINKPGAGSSVGTAFVAREPADGYTTLLATSSFTINPNLYANANYDPIKDFAPIAAVGNSPFGIIVRADSPIDTFAKLVAGAKANPAVLTYSSGGIGSMGNLAAELLKSRTGINIVHVPYKGLQPAVAGLLSGDVDMTFSDMATALPFIKAGSVKPLAVTPASRLPWIPDVPTIAESGVPGYNVVLWNGVFVPAATPQDIIDRLYTGIVNAYKAPDKALTDRYYTIGETLPKIQSREAFEAFVKSDLQLWKTTIADAHIAANL